jgi:hypothetical protein
VLRSKTARLHEYLDDCTPEEVGGSLLGLPAFGTE